MTNADLPEEKITPILLLKKAYFTTLLIIWCIWCTGVSVGSGVSHTLAQIRSKYGLPQRQAQIKKLLAKSLTCIKHQGGPYKTNPTPPWPKIKVNESPAFINTGLDYFGPLYVNNGTVRTKAWVCIFICNVVRPIHLERVDGLAAVQFLRYLKRLVARWGKSEVLSEKKHQKAVFGNHSTSNNPVQKRSCSVNSRPLV